MTACGHLRFPVADVELGVVPEGGVVTAKDFVAGIQIEARRLDLIALARGRSDEQAVCVQVAGRRFQRWLLSKRSRSGGKGAASPAAMFAWT